MKEVELRREGNRLVIERCDGRARISARVFPDGEIHAGCREADAEEALGVVARALARECERTGVRVLSLERAEDAAWNRLLVAAGFVLHRRKLLVERGLESLEEVDEGFAWKTLSEIGDREFLAWLSRSAEGDPFEEGEARDFEREYRELLDYAGERLDRTLWRVALLDGEPVGVVLPQSFGGDPEEGSIFYVAILPVHRGRGLGRRLHRAGLALLARAGVRHYVGSTDERNAPMARIFVANGCRVTATQLFYRIP